MAKRYEQKGSLSLRSEHMDYGRATLISNWHEAREAEPKDHKLDYRAVDYNAKQRNLHQSTYNRILNVTDGTLPISTCHDHMSQINQSKDFDERVSRRPMIDEISFLHTDKPRKKMLRYLNTMMPKSDTGAPEIGFGAILPRHPKNHNIRYHDTTYRVDYKDTYPYEAKPQVEVTEKDNSAAFKKCHSQFTDPSDYRRHGRNTWNNETGIYANNDVKREVFKPSNPIPERL